MKSLSSTALGLSLTALGALFCALGCVAEPMTTRAGSGSPGLPGQNGPVEPLGPGAEPTAPVPSTVTPSDVTPPALPPNADTKAACTALGSGIFPGAAPLRRLTRNEYERTVRALLNDPTLSIVAFPPEARAFGFVNNADAQNVSTQLVERYGQAAESLASRFVADATRLSGCDPRLGVEACVDTFIAGVGQLLYRRPLSSAEVARLKLVYQDGVSGEGAALGAEMVVEVMLQSSAFLYKPEFGAEAVAPGVVKLAPHEMATRLSYLIWGAPPDAALYQAAANDELGTREQVLAQAQRLLADPRSKYTVEQFHDEWLELERVGSLERSSETYPGFGPTTPGLLQQETRRFIDEVFTNDDGRLATLFTAPYTVLNPELAAFYGTSEPSGWARVSAGAGRHAGLFTQGGVLASHSYAEQTSPVRRGKFVREHILCQSLPPPPPGVVIEIPALDPNLTTRQRFAEHASSPACAGCHSLIDPVGLAFEQFDAAGRYRETENGLPIDASGELIDADVAGPFVGPLELAQKLAGSELAANCVVRHWGRFAYARAESVEDACTLDKLNTTLKESGGHLPTLVRALTDTDAFLYRKAVTQ